MRTFVIQTHKGYMQTHKGHISKFRGQPRNVNPVRVTAVSVGEPINTKQINHAYICDSDIHMRTLVIHTHKSAYSLWSGGPPMAYMSVHL
jgi:hypothetical protein